MIKHAVLLDTMGIQNYVFGSTALKENLGASRNVELIFSRERIESISVQPLKENGKYIGFIGGGNALLFFNSQPEALKFIQEFSLKLFLSNPGIKINSAIKEFDMDNYGSESKSLFEELADNKRSILPITEIRSFGFTDDCRRTQNCASFVIKEKDTILPVSYESKNKIESGDSVSDSLKSILPDIDVEINEKYILTKDLGKLGQLKGRENHIAIVHIDGNEFGKKFTQIKSITEANNLSSQIRKAVSQSFKVMIERFVTDKKEKKALYDEEFKPFFEQSSHKEILPIRPIIIGGDDITFVCDGRLGIYFAKLFIEEFQKQTFPNGEKFSACAGVAIIKTKYPFYRGYQLAEELCKSAKERRKMKNSNGSWLDFHISSGGFTGTLSEIRDKYYMNDKSHLCLRPYLIDSSDDSILSLYSAINATKILLDIPSSKIKELREVLTYGKDSQALFLKEMKARQESLPYNPNFLFQDVQIKQNSSISTTPFFDLVELTEYYPLFELGGK